MYASISMSRVVMSLGLFVRLSDGASHSSGTTRGKDQHLLILITHRFRLGKTCTGFFFDKHPVFFVIPNMISLSVLFQFNLAIKDIPEVTHEAKKALSGQLPGIGRSMCVEISLKTSEVLFFF